LIISNDAKADILPNQYLILFAAFRQKLRVLWERHWQVWPMFLKLALANYLSISQEVSDSIHQAPVVSELVFK
jgi:hypothetical protein